MSLLLACDRGPQGAPGAGGKPGAGCTVVAGEDGSAEVVCPDGRADVVAPAACAVVTEGRARVLRCEGREDVPLGEEVELAAVRGVVTLFGGAPAEGASVTAVRDELSFEATADANGAFELDELPPGIYELRARHGLYADGALANLPVAPGAALELPPIVLSLVRPERPTSIDLAPGEDAVILFDAAFDGEEGPATLLELETGERIPLGESVYWTSFHDERFVLAGSRSLRELAVLDRESGEIERIPEVDEYWSAGERRLLLMLAPAAGEDERRLALHRLDTGATEVVGPYGSLAQWSPAGAIFSTTTGRALLSFEAGTLFPLPGNASNPLVFGEWASYFQPSGEASELHLRELATGAESVVPQLPLQNIARTAAAGAAVAYVRGDGQLVLHPLDGEPLVLGAGAAPSFTYDGNVLLFDAAGERVAYDRRTGSTRRWDAKLISTWSPDGARVALRDGAGALHVLALADGSTTPFPTAVPPNWDAVRWLGPERLVVRDVDQALWAWQAGDGAPRAFAERAAWFVASPGGASLCVQRDGWGGEASWQPFDGGEGRLLDLAGGCVGFSPDATHLAFVSDAGRADRLNVLDLASGRVTPVMDGTDEGTLGNRLLLVWTDDPVRGWAMAWGMYR